MNKKLFKSNLKYKYYSTHEKRFEAGGFLKKNKIIVIYLVGIT